MTNPLVIQGALVALGIILQAVAIITVVTKARANSHKSNRAGASGNADVDMPPQITEAPHIGAVGPTLKPPPVLLLDRHSNFSLSAWQPRERKLMGQYFLTRPAHAACRVKTLSAVPSRRLSDYEVVDETDLSSFAFAVES